VRTVAKIVAKETNRKIIFGDSLLRAETLWQEKSGDAANQATALSPLKFRSLSPAKCEIIDTRTAKDFKKKEFEIFSPELLEMLAQAKENNEHTFLFCARKGLSPTTVCSDCGTVVACTNCAAPVVLYVKKSGNQVNNLFVCGHCGETRPADTKCVYCSGWRLTTLGIGIETIVEKIEKLLPKNFTENPLIILDKDHVTTHTQALKARNKFYNTPGSICIGTELALPYLNQPVENSAVVSLDSFFSIPDFRIHEKIFHILLDIRAFTQKKMLVQTRQKENSPGHKIMDYALKGNLIDFYRDEIEERKLVNYPPFSVFIKLSIKGDKKIIREKMENIKKDFALSSHELSVFDAFGAEKANTVHGLLTLPTENWPNPVLLAKLRALPLSVQIKVDPDTLL
jgi:primosomal protein N' (replication factor Y)